MTLTLEQQLVDKGTQLGFAAVGIAAAAPARTLDIYTTWLARGCAAGMDYLERHADLRSDPGELAPGTMSVIVAAACYPVNDQPGTGFSCYSRGRDYHNVLRDKLRLLAGFLGESVPLSVTRICVDSAPVLEREWAIRSGIGWRGKQGQIVCPGVGCCVLLCELFVDAVLEPSPSASSQCGDCTRCIDACPTGALDRNGFVDARKCISYLTIEHKGEIPQDMHTLIGGALFGCDRCTAVCPQNRHGHVMPEFREREMPGPEECLTMTEEEFARRFSDTAVLRTGLERLQRNAAVALRSGG